VTKVCVCFSVCVWVFRCLESFDSQWVWVERKVGIDTERAAGKESGPLGGASEQSSFG